MGTKGGRRRLGARAAVVVAVLALLATACGGDDGVDVNSVEESDASSSASGSESGSASGSEADAAAEDDTATDEEGDVEEESGSASGISEEEVAQTTENPLIQDAVDGYRVYVQEQISDMQAETKVFADAVRDGDIEATKAAYPVSRRPWERIEPIAGLIEDIDGAVDAREDDFDGPEDPNFTGWHKIEWYTWDQGDLTEAGPFADQLEADLQTLADTAETLDLAPGVLTVGAQELIEEVAAPDGKLSGEEDRYSGTDLYDFKANVEGSEALVDLLAPVLEEADPELLTAVESSFDELNGQLEVFGSFEAGYVHYDEVTEDQRGELAATLGGLAESLSLLNGALGLE